MARFEDLLGKILTNIEKTNVERTEDEELIFTLNDGGRYRQSHHQDCCERVTIEDICGDLNDLIGSPILLAEEVVHEQNVDPEGVKTPEHHDSFTWTFYKLATVKGGVTIRWYGGSNGHYAESVSFDRMTAK